ncbi:MAG: Gx transporter family protein [Clostridiales bacterium]|nr:Gx transporter family protein [Clostridiales bacterium]
MKTKTAYLGMFTALAMILSYVESLFPAFYGIPGVKLGLANSMSLVILYLIGVPGAFCVSLLRVVLSGFLFGNLFSIAYSLAGAIMSLTVMAAMKRTKVFSVAGISMCGGMAHNTGQLLVAMLLVENLNLFYYLPVLLLSGLVTGLVIGMISAEILKRLPNRQAETDPVQHPPQNDNE